MSPQTVAALRQVREQYPGMRPALDRCFPEVAPHPVKDRVANFRESAAILGKKLLELKATLAAMGGPIHIPIPGDGWAPPVRRSENLERDYPDLIKQGVYGMALSRVYSELREARCLVLRLDLPEVWEAAALLLAKFPKLGKPETD